MVRYAGYRLPEVTRLRAYDSDPAGPGQSPRLPAGAGSLQITRPCGQGWTPPIHHPDPRWAGSANRDAGSASVLSLARANSRQARPQRWVLRRRTIPGRRTIVPVHPRSTIRSVARISRPLLSPVAASSCGHCQAHAADRFRASHPKMHKNPCKTTLLADDQGRFARRTVGRSAALSKAARPAANRKVAATVTVKAPQSTNSANSKSSSTSGRTMKNIAVA